MFCTNRPVCHSDEGGISASNFVVKIPNLCLVSNEDPSLRRNDNIWGIINGIIRKRIYLIEIRLSCIFALNCRVLYDSMIHINELCVTFEKAYHKTMKFINNLFGKHNPSETEILNSGLSFAMEFGKDWLQPINKRLARNFSFLNSIELDKYNAICKNVIDDGQEFVFKILENLEQNNQSITEKELKQKFKDFILIKYNWVNEENISRHFSQICYYVHKDGLDNVIKS